jgi:hypothetical protein
VVNLLAIRTAAQAEGRVEWRGLPTQPQPPLVAGCGPVAGPERRLGRPGAARDGVCNRACLNGRIPSKDFLLMCVEKYPEKYAGKYRQRYPEPCARLRGHKCLQLNSDLYPDLSNKLFAELNREEFEKSFQQLFRKSFASSFDSLFGLKYRQF